MSTVDTTVGRFVWHDHVSGDPEGARRFYTELLGWDYEMFDAGSWQYPMIKVNGKTHGGFGPTQGDAPPHWLCHVAVDDVDAAAGRVEAGGGSIVAPAMDIPDVGRMVVVADPQGAVVSLYTSVSEGYEPAEGVFVWDEVLTTDVEAAKRFYGEVVGWETREMDMGPNGVYVLFSSGGADRAGCMSMPPGAEGVPPNWMTYIGTGDADATAAKAEDLGATIMREPWDVETVGRIAIFADPAGAVIGLFQPASS
jgi:predicted enzyme related to lactoylglutathione lyase